MSVNQSNQNEIIQFESSAIRRIWDEDTKQWFFAVVDVVAALSEARIPRDYWYKMKKRDFADLSPIWRQFPMKHPKNNRTYQTDCANVEDMLRIIQSIPSPKAEPFKLWMARVGRERIEEATDPWITLQRLKQQYQAIGFDDEWINVRLKAFDISDDLIAEWQERGVIDEQDQNRLLDEISRGTFGISRDEHKEVKSLEGQDDLPDNMTQLELILKMLGEGMTTEIAKKRDAQGIEDNEKVAQRGGKLAGDTRLKMEAELDRPIVTPDNALPKPDTPDQLHG